MIGLRRIPLVHAVNEALVSPAVGPNGYINGDDVVLKSAIGSKEKHKSQKNDQLCASWLTDE